MDDSDRHLPFGLRSDGRLVPVSQVARGEACDCVCPDCARPFVAHKGDERAHHFQHKAAPGQPETCLGYYETALHLLAKQVLREADRLWLPPLEARYGYHRHMLRLGGWVTIGNVRTEVRVGPIVADAIAEVEDTDLIVEVHVTHRSTADKVQFLRETDRSAIELDLSQARGMAPEAIEAFILGKAPRHWLHAPGLTEANARLQARIEAALARQQEADRQAALARQREIERELEADRLKEAERVALLQGQHEAYEAMMREAEASRAAQLQRRADVLRAFPAWAETYYPTRVSAPPEGLGGRGLNARELIDLFDRTTSRLCHLALIDHALIRNSVDGYRRNPEWVAISAAVRGSWRRHPAF